MKLTRKNRHRKSIKRRPQTIYYYSMEKRTLNKKKVAMAIALFVLIIIWIVKLCIPNDTIETSENGGTVPVIVVPIEDDVNQKEPTNTNKEITDWKLRLANYKNVLPEDFTIEVANIDETRQFDARAIKYLNQMLNDMRKDGITDIWVQSAYRSVERQKELYDQSVQKYLNQGKTQEEAEKLTDEYINKPGTSEHNIGLAVDFNFVNDEFEESEAFKWLKKHAEDYGFILRYPKEKEHITKIAYESWHWRYVGEEHAKKINELGMCLEEYIEFLESN